MTTHDTAAVSAPQANRRKPSRPALLLLSLAIAIPGLALAKQPVASDAGCVVFPPAYIDSGYPFTVKIVRDPSYTGVWSQPMAEVNAEFTRTDGGTVTATYSETTSRYGYGVTYVTANLLAPSCNGIPCELDTAADVTITATIREPINKGKRVRETICTPARASLNPSM
jgi:hypothetical protein